MASHLASLRNRDLGQLGNSLLDTWAVEARVTAVQHRFDLYFLNKIFAPEKRFNKGCLASLFPKTKESYSMAIQIKPLIQHWILYVVVMLKMDFVVFREIWLESRSYNFYFLLDYLSKLPADSGDLKNTSGI